MGRRVSIPVRVVNPTREEHRQGEAEAAGTGVDVMPVGTPQASDDGTGQSAGATPWPEEEGIEMALPDGAAEQVTTAGDGALDELEMWRDQALRLQAEMENYRRRQQRWAQDQIEVERYRLLEVFLQVVDDLDRALAVPDPNQEGSDRGEGLRRGVELTRRAALQLLHREGVEPVEAEQRPFDPIWHDAVATVPRNGINVDPHTVIQVLQPGYRLGDRLLRPAKVVVAV